MGQKYSINSAGRIVAERDIYSLGGFIPKGRVGAKIADESQLSQNGECWVAGGDMSMNPWVKVSDNVYIGDYSPGGVTAKTNPAEIKGNTLIPGAFRVYLPATLPTSDLVIKDSFIGVTMDVLFGVSSKCHPVEQGRYNQGAPKGTLFTSASMKLDANNFVRNTATVILGKDTYVYLPAGFNARIYWAYYDVSNQLAYAGESETVSTNLYKLSHPVYNMCMIAFAKNPTLTPAELEASGAKILGHVSGSIITEVRGSSESGVYVMDNSSLKIQTDNFGLVSFPIRTLAGRMINTTCVTEALTERKVFGTFTNIDYMEYFWNGDTNHRDTVITASDCPLLRVSPTTIKRSLLDTGTLVLRNCIVPAGDFEHDIIDGDTYENIDFSYTREFLSTRVVNRRLICSHRQGLYNMFAEGGNMLGRISYPDNVKDATCLTGNLEVIMLDGNMIESGTYAGDTGKTYDANKIPAANRVRMIRPVSTIGAVFPNIPTGYAVRAVHYLDESFILRKAVDNPITMESEFPFYVMSFQKTDPEASLPVSEFVSKNAYLNVNNYTKVPEITGSAYVGTGVIVRGDVQLHGDPYVNRVFDVNEWERGEMALEKGVYWEDAKADIRLHARFRLKHPIPVSNGDTFTAEAGYEIRCVGLDADKNVVADSGSWVQTDSIKSDRVKYEIIVVRKGADALIEDSDIPLANVKYLRAFKKRRYIVNELDRESPEDILLSVDYWEQGTAGGGQADAGKTYEELKATSGTTIRLKRPINVSPTSSISSVSGFSKYIRVLDAVTKFRLGEPLNSAKMALLAVIIQKDPSAAITPPEIPNSRLVLEFVPQPRIIAPYGYGTITVGGVKVRMYDNAVLSKPMEVSKQEGGTIILKGDAVARYDFIITPCFCSNGHSDAIVP